MSLQGDGLYYKVGSYLLPSRLLQVYQVKRAGLLQKKMPNRNRKLLEVEHLAYLPATRASSTDKTQDDLSMLVACLEEA